MPNFDDIDLTNVIMDGDPYGEFEDAGGGGGGGEGHVYDLKMSATNDEMTLTEDGNDKTTLPLVGTFVGTRAEWNALSATDKAKYRILHFTDETVGVFSHVGQIVESTTLDTEAKVKAIYGVNTSWIQHTGYVLRGADSGVVADQAQNDGGADSVTVSSVASHNHTQNAHSHNVRVNSTFHPAGGGSAPNSWAVDAGYNAPIGATYTATATNIANGSNYTVNTLPKYKNVYIWERIA